MTQDIEMKELNIENELYVHFHKSNFIQYRKNLTATPEILTAEIYAKYGEDARYFQNKMKALTAITNKDGQNIANIIGLMNDINNGAMNATIESKVAQDLPIMLKNALNATYATSSSLSKVEGNIQKQIAILDKYLKLINSVIEEIQKNDELYIDFILNKYKNDDKALKNIQTLFKNDNQLSLLAINQTALTSYQSLKTKINQLEQESKALKAGTATGKTQNKKGEMITYTSFIYPMHFLFTNILGGIGEGVGAAVALKYLNDFMKSIQIPDMQITMEGTGTTKIKGGTTSKADYNISINSETGNINLSFGISAKAQFTNNHKKITTTFETTKLYKILMISNQQVKYLFYNMLYHNTNDDWTAVVRRYLAAKNMRNAVSGANQGENVLFLQYLDTIIGLDELFTSFSQLSMNQLPTLSIEGAKGVRTASDYVTRRGQKLKSVMEKNNMDLNPEDKYIVAYVRSRQAIMKLNDLQTQIQWAH